MPPNLPACIDTSSCSGMEPSATVRKYLHVCISGNALSACLTSESNSKQRNEESRRTVWPGAGHVRHAGVTWQKHMATLGAANGGLGCSRFLWRPLTSAPNAKVLCTEDRKQLGKVIHLLFMSYDKAQIKSSLGLHTFTALATYQLTECSRA